MATKKRSKWVTLFLDEVLRWDDNEDEWHSVDLENLSDADIVNEAYEISVEVSVVRANNKHGLKSWGWGDSSKIILFDSGDEIRTKADIEWMKKVAQTTADALNKAGL